LQICSELVDDGAAGVRSPKLSPAASEILLAEGKACGSWQEVLRRRSVRRPLSPAALPLVTSQRGYSEGVADVLLMGIVPLSAEILFNALVVWRTATVPVNAAIPGVPSVRWLALLHRLASALTLVML
jgi:hypothetical protein